MIAVPPTRPNCLQFREKLHFERGIFAAISIALGLGIWLARIYGASNDFRTLHGAYDNFKAWLPAGGLLVLGVLTLFDRNELIVDRTTRNLIHQWGFPLSLFTSWIPFSSLKAVVLRHHRSLMKAGQKTHTIELELTKGWPIEVSGEEDGIHDELKGRHLAEVLARLFEVEMVEHLREGDIHRAPGALNRPVQPQTEAPPTSKSKFRTRFHVVEHQSDVQLQVMGPAFFSGSVAFCVLLGGLFSAFVIRDILPELIRTSATSRPVVSILVALLYAFTMIPLVGFLFERVRVSYRRDDLTAGKAGLTITKHNGFKSETNTFTPEELEELRLESDDVLTLAAISDKKIVRFGKGLSRAELQWIQKQLLVGLGKGHA